jgi:hypothetical protein
MSKEQEQTLRDFHFSFAELIANIENCERLCPVDTLMEMCETLAGIMAEQTEIIAAIEATGSNKIKERFPRPLIGERFYSSHLDALCDMMRLAKHLKELSERKDELLKAMKRMERFDVPPQIDVKLIRSTLEAIPKVKTLKSNE